MLSSARARLVALGLLAIAVAPSFVDYGRRWM